MDKKLLFIILNTLNNHSYKLVYKSDE